MRSYFVQAMIAFIDDYREAHWVEPICKVLPIGPSTYHDHVQREGFDVARWTVARLMKAMGLEGIPRQADPHHGVMSPSGRWFR